MIYRFGAVALIALAVSSGAAVASGLPSVKSGGANPVPECATPGRLMAYLKERNPKLDPRFEDIAAEYQRIGGSLRMRWDYAFFQMMVDTGGLAFGRDSRSGDVRPDQNNFAGLGATGKGERGERFPDVATGVTAHLQHVLVYAGEKVPDAVAERTRKVQEWGVLSSWHKGLKGPVTFKDLAAKWAPGADDYGKTIEATARRFYEDQCKKDDPRPDLMAANSAAPAAPAPSAAAPVRVAAEEEGDKVSGAEVARNAIAAARAEAGASKRTGLGAGSIAKGIKQPAETPGTEPATPASFTILNAPKPEAVESTETPPVAAPSKPASVQQASAAAIGKTAPQAAVTAAKCRVWQASYGGQRAIIIRSKSEGFTNYTVLDVNEGAEKREADAYIQAYAKGGEMVGEFGNQTQALDKAFDLCPEG